MKSSVVPERPSRLRNRDDNDDDDDDPKRRCNLARNRRKRVKITIGKLHTVVQSIHIGPSVNW